MPGWIVSPLCSNNHITQPHIRAAKTEKYRESGGTGFTAAVVRCGLRVARGINDAITREQMYNTTLFRHGQQEDVYVRPFSPFTQGGKGVNERTCSLIAFLSPNTR